MKIITFLFLFLGIYNLMYSQEVGNVYNLNSYKYVFIKIPKYQYSNQDDKEIIREVRNLFINTGFKTYTDEVDTNKLPYDFKTDTCITLICKIAYNTNKKDMTEWLRITLKNCIDEIVYENTGKSIWSMSGAIEDAYEPISNFKYEYDPNKKITPVK